MHLKGFKMVSLFFNIKSLATHREAILDPFLNVLKIKYKKNCKYPFNIYYSFYFPPICPLFVMRRREGKTINESTT